ncbi:hypothetical protein AXF42_Ash004044 [Apostasia shenzhenica]|uniref:Uncharacterized protein n=1 Tax=Apostasia shenzhenica TaxID=1088818 RepID=A0A2I0A1V6_9ASPA|nr:hypothetical protein AXF42_Ash004044 [Apostasia shenzhenica]
MINTPPPLIVVRLRRLVAGCARLRRPHGELETRGRGRLTAPAERRSNFVGKAACRLGSTVQWTEENGKPRFCISGFTRNEFTGAVTN